MGSVIKIEQFELKDKQALLGFLQRAYPDNPRQSNEFFWNWHFLNKLDVPSKIPVWLAKSGDVIAGQVATIPVKLNINDEMVDAMWILDFIVGEDFRRQGIGKKLILAVEEQYPYLLGVNTNQQHAPALLKSVGWEIVTLIPRFHKILFPGDALREISHIKPLRKLVNLAFTPFRPRKDNNYFKEHENLRFIEKFDSSFDILWQESRKQWTCSILRNSETLNWQYKNQPEKKFEILGYFKDNKLLGYVILFFRKANDTGSILKASIADICYHPDNPQKIAETLIEGALQLAIERKTGGLVTDVINPLLEKTFKKFGFLSIKSPLQLMAKSPQHQKLIYDSKEWFLTRGDSDISIFENPNL